MTTVRRTARVTLVAGALAAITAASTGGAFAGTAGAAGTAGKHPVTATDGAGLQALQAAAAIAVAGREAALNEAISEVNANAYVSTADQQTALSTLSNDLSGVTGLGATIAAATTFDAAEASYLDIFSTYRVYALGIPQTLYALASDTVTDSVLPKLTAAQASLTALLRLEPSKNTSTVAAAMSNLGTQISAITSDTTGLSATVLAFTPAQYDANHALLSPTRATAVTVATDIATAGQDITTVSDALQ